MIGPGSWHRDPGNAWIAGVCAGLAAQFGLGTGVVRIAALLFAVATTPVPAVLVYAILAFVMPVRPWRPGTRRDFL